MISEGERIRLVRSEELSRLFADYHSYHRNPTNKLFHYIGIPVIVFTILGLLWKASPPVAVLVALGVILYDLRLSVRRTVPFAAFIGIAALVAPRLSATVLWAGFVLGWVLQLAGHYVYEKNSPAFLDNLRQLLVAPLWIVESLVARREAPAAAPGSGPRAE
jgi:uncharacterized membrane protein YGL010W